MSIDQIKSLIKDDLSALDAQISENLKANVELIPTIIKHIVDSGGKRLRPILTILCARALNTQQSDHIKLATIIEFVHTATLLHDDVVDTSDLRRGQPTANVIWGNSAGILVGDFLYSRAFQMINQLRSWTVSDILADATSIIAEGEALQLTNQNNPDISDQDYYEVIKCKTAVLFAAATQLGALSAGADTQTQKALYNYGLHLGLGFQIMDDYLDYAVSSTEMGKNAGDDLAEGKTTLPLIYAMKYASKENAEIIRNAIKQGGLESFDTILSIIQNTPAFHDIKTQAHKEIEKAQATLSILPDSEYKNALISVSELAVNRRS